MFGWKDSVPPPTERNALMLRKPGFLIAVVATLILANTDRVSAQSDRVDSCIAAQMSIRHIPGLALAVIRDGVPVKVKGYGLGNVELNVPVSPQTIFQSASIGKQFTATLVMLLVEQGKINLDAPITTYLPNSPAAWGTITARHLLTHTSGIVDHAGDSLAVNFRLDYTEDQLLEKIRQMPLAFKPGEKWAYSNSGYVLLGILIHKVSGQFHGDLLQRYIFDPLSMGTARIISEADIIPNRAAGYRLENGEWKNQDWVSPTLNRSAAGALYLTVLDLIKWDSALYSGRILSKASYDQIWSPVRLATDSLQPYGFGWFLSPVNGRKAVYHPGGWQGFNNYIARYTDDKLTVILLSNLSPDNPGKIAQAVAAIYVPALAERVPHNMPDRDPSFKPVVESLFGKPDTFNLDLFTRDYRQKGNSNLKSNQSLLNIFGPVQSIEMVGYDSDKNGTTLLYRVRYKAGSRIVTITRAKSGEISIFSSSTE
jgi:CubicO group peptidase (beta-lactamase class C family)